MGLKFSVISEVLELSSAKFGDFHAFSWKSNEKWNSITYKQLKDSVDRLSCQLLKLGVGKGDKIIIISRGRPEFNIVDFASLQIGAVVVALFPNYSFELIEELTRHCDAKIAFVDSNYLSVVESVRDDSSSPLSMVYSMDKDVKQPSLWTLIEAETLTESSFRQLGEARNGICSKDLAVIFYTSGTSDRPNGAMISHESLAASINNCYKLFGLRAGEKVLSYLPACHAYERAHHYFYMASGLHIHYSESPQETVSNAQEVKPAMFTTVPMLLEKVLEVIRLNVRMIDKGKQSEYLDTINFAQDLDPKSVSSLKSTEEFKNMESNYFSNWRKVLGGELKLISCAGAPLPKHVGQFFYSIGIPIICCYGLTEIVGVTYQRVNEIPNYDEAGTFLDGIEAKLSDKEELLLRTTQCMTGYYKNPDLTAKVVNEEGWFHTGDSCEITKSNGLKIKGRLRHMFKMPSGEYVSPSHIETILIKSQFIRNVFVYNSTGSLCALVVPESTHMNQELGKSLRKAIEQDIHRLYNKSVHVMQRIKTFELVFDNWGPDTGELTPTMKIKRHIIRDKYRNILEAS